MQLEVKMKEFFDKLSSYNLFNYLLPGIIFAIFVEVLTSYSILTDNIIIGLFLYYFIGLIISRIGSLIIEPLLIKLKFIKFGEYADFLKASTIDKEIKTLSESNNMFRTFLSSFFILLLINFYEFIDNKLSIPDELGLVLGLILLITIFLFAYKKQTSYITKRINYLVKK